MALVWPEPALDRSLLGWDPLDEFAVLVGDWIMQNGLGKENLEIEAKVGRIIEGSTGQRVQLPVRTETIVDMQRGWKFESKMSNTQHGRINSLLNQAVENRKSGIKYERQNEVDLFYRDRAGSGKVRVTKDTKTFQTKAIVRKSRLADLNIYCPNRSLDYRISVNIEEPRSQPPDDETDFTREKNRLHYTHQRICVDLTQVHGGDSAEPSNELELEFRDAKQLMDEAEASEQAAGRQEWTPYYDSILIFLNNIRLLIRNADG